jgi:hypothetical protein
MAEVMAQHACGCRVGIEACFSPLHPAADKAGPVGACGFPLGTVHKCGDPTNGWRSAIQELLNPEPTTAQERFDALYISSLEIGERLGVSRPAVMHARRRGVLPEPVCVNDGQIYIWERKEVEPYLKAWETSVKLRRGETVVIPLGTSNPFLEPKRLDE